MIKNKANGGIHLLLVEDNEDEVMLMQQALAELTTAYSLHVARNGNEAMIYLRNSVKAGGENRPNLLLLDLNMPIKSGLEVLGEIKSDGSLKSIPVIIFTNSNSTEDVRLSYEYQASCFITKPLNYDGLESVVKLIEAFWFQTVQFPSSKSA